MGQVTRKRPDGLNRKKEEGRNSKRIKLFYKEE
jgi:hypothetical protein